MSKISIFNKDTDSALVQQLNPIVRLPKITLPSSGAGATSVVKRAQCTDFSQDLLPRFGIERVMTQQIQEVQGESGPNGERVFKPINDAHDAVRFVGNFALQIDVNGQHIDASDSTSFIEITFYGTGLNILTRTNASTTAAVDGNAPGANFMPASLSNVLDGRSYSWNGVVNAVSGLTLGLHTVKLQSASAFRFYGFEILNTTSTLQQTPGISYLGGKRLYTPALTTSSPTSGFTNTYGTAGSKGAHVLIYQKPDGTIAKDARYTEASQLNLTTADHTNESVIRTYNWREFGVGRSDDFSSLTTAASTRAFTLDDGTTTLVGSGVINQTTIGEALAHNANGDFWTFTFVGTGCDILRKDEANGGSDTYTLFVDGISAGTLSSVGKTSHRVEKLVSGLPYGTHTIKVTRTSASTYNLGLIQLITYGPSKPALPTGCVELADYYVMGDYVANSTAGANTVALGILRKLATREFVYSGTWLAAAMGTGLASEELGGWEIYSSTTSDYLQYTFFGTGFEHRFSVNATSSTWQYTVDGSTNLSGFTTSTYGTFTSFTASTGTLVTAAGSVVGGGVRVSGLALGLHTVKVTKTAGTGTLYGTAIDVITPIHSPKGNAPGDIQNTLNVGSCALSDNRVFSSIAVKPLANWAQAVGVASSPTTTSTSFVPIPDMSATLKTNGNPIQISYSVSCLCSALAFIDVVAYVNGSVIGTELQTYTPAIGAPTILSQAIIVPAAAGTHKIDLYWRTNTGTLSASTVRRTLTVKEL